MLHHSTIRRVHDWATAQAGPVTVYRAADALSLGKKTIQNSFLELMQAGFATRENQPPVGTFGGKNPPPPRAVQLWTVTGSPEQVMRKFGADVPPDRMPLELFEHCPSIWEYGDRCKAAAA